MLTRRTVATCPSTRKRRAVAAVAALVVAASLPAAVATTPAPAGYRTTMRRDLAPGVEHSALSKVDPRFMVNVARLAPGAEAALRVVSAGDSVGPRVWSELDLPTAMCRRVGCLAAINGDFFIPSTSEPYGGVVTGGRLLRSPAPGRPQLSVDEDGAVTVGGLAWSGTVTPKNGAPLAISAVNARAVPDGVMLYTSDYGTRTPSGAHEVVLRYVNPLAGAAVRVELVRVEDGGTDIPADGAVLAGLGGGAEAVRALWDRRAEAGRTVLRLDTEAAESIGIWPVLVSRGRAVAHGLSGDMTARGHGRSLVGVTKDGSVLLVTVDDAQKGSSGASLEDAAEILLALGAVEGGNLDGGGGTTFVVEGEVANLPTDGPDSPAARHPERNEYAPGRFERPAVNALVFVRLAGGGEPQSG